MAAWQSILLVCCICAAVLPAILASSESFNWANNAAGIEDWQAQVQQADQASHSPLVVARRIQSRTASTESLTAEACLASSLSDVAQSCSAHPTDRHSQSQAVSRDRLVKLVLRCLSNDDTTTPGAARNQPMRMLLATSVFASLMKNMTQVYTQLTDVPIRVDMPSLPTAAAARLQSIANAANYSATHEAWLIPVSASGDGIASGAFKTITNLVTLDNRLGWEGLMPVLRTSGLLYKSQVFAMPLNTQTFHLAYRKDVFEQYNLTVPRTWKELLDFAVTKNGTNGMHAFCGSWGPCFNLGLILFRAMLASYHQTHGPKQGWLFDADSMELLLDSPAVAESIDILKGLYAASPPDGALALGCPTYGYRFTGPTGGQCLMSIVHPVTIKYASHQSRINVSANLYGNLGIAPWPGSETVLDRATNTLVPCDIERCPYATRVANPDGGTFLINRSPVFEAQLLALNARSASDISFFTMSVLSYLSAPETSNVLVFTPDSEIFPSRTSQLDWKLWVAAGWNEHDARAYCSDSIAALNHPNVNFQLRIPGAPAFVTLTSQVASNAFSGMPMSKVLETAKAAGLAILNRTYNGNKTALKAEYWASINRDLPPSPAPPPSPPLPAPVADTTSSATNDNQNLLIILCVVVPACALGLVAAFAVRYRWLAKLGANGGRVRHPGMGPTTTLCVTDIEESTLLWESCDALVMDTSVKLHNGCIRNLAAKHAGYETVWEGDSFVIAFSHPTQAVAFCMAVQKELLLLPWPAALLQTSQAGEVWCVMAHGRQTKNGSVSRRPKSVTSAIAPFAVPGPGSAQVANSSGPWSSLDTNNSYMSANFRLPHISPAPKSQDHTGPFLTASSACVEELDPPAGMVDTLFQTGSRRISLDTPSQHRVTFTLPTSPGTLDGGPASRFAVDDTQPVVYKDVGAQWRGQWVACAPGTPHAVLAFRGLRVRLGMHAGIETAACVNYNSVMRRYHYTGPVRVISNAVASAGHGGYTLLSSSTASLLCSDSTGVLEGLPSDCSVFNLGSHELANVDDNTELLLVLPNTLQCRLGLQQKPLRCLGTKVPGVLAAPIPTRSTVDPTALVYIQFSGLDVLLAWNAKEATQAVKCATACLHLEIGEWRGVISEDGLAAVMQGRKTKTAGLMSATSFPDQVVPGRMAIAFDTGSAALSCALAARRSLLRLAWSEQLLAHELCEQVGHEQDSQDIISWAQETGPLDTMTSADTIFSRPEGTLDGQAGPTSSGKLGAPEANAYKTGPGGISKARQASLLDRIASASVSTAGSFTTHTRSQELKVASPGASAPHSFTSGASASSLILPQLAATTSRGNLMDRLVSTGELFSKPSLAVSRSTTQMSRGASLNGNLLRVQTSRDDVKGTSPRDARKYTTLDAPMLRGLRIRTVIVPGKRAEFVVATRSSGRCVYGGKPAKVAAKLLKKVHVGQVMVESKLLQAALQV